ncbi:DUF3885 domain-containing protein [Clostridium sp.]|uniref:DUF3885 domain-containing protein n=1 Tax=Clostridium sp. TaxID=1506 RepID=UPI003D6CD72E
MLKEQLQEELELLGLNNLEHPIFYNGNNGIRFEIGMGSVYGKHNKPRKVYIENALRRAIKIYNKGIHSPGILMWEIYSKSDKEKHSFEILFNKKISPILPQEEFSQDIDMEDGYKLKKTYFYWNLEESKIPIDKLFREILLGDLGGVNAFVSSIYLFDIDAHVMLHLYDDRGLDIVAHDKNTLMPLYQELNAWILDYDREQIDERFSN